MADESSNSIIHQQVGEVPINTSVKPEDLTHGIPVDVLDQGYTTYGMVQQAAIHLMGSAPLNELDDNGNLKSVPDAKAKAIADRCVKYAYMLLDSLASGNPGSGSSDEDEDGCCCKIAYEKKHAWLCYSHTNIEECNKCTYHSICPCVSGSGSSGGGSGSSDHLDTTKCCCYQAIEQTGSCLCYSCTKPEECEKCTYKDICDCKPGNPKERILESQQIKNLENQIKNSAKPSTPIPSMPTLSNLDSVITDPVLNQQVNDILRKQHIKNLSDVVSSLGLVPSPKPTPSQVTDEELRKELEEIMGPIDLPPIDIDQPKH